MLAALYRKAQYLSLDIVIGALILLRFFSSIHYVFPSWSVYFLLGSSVWIIYTVDHLRDAEKAPNSSRARYQFHLKFHKSLKTGIVTLLIVSIYAIFETSVLILVSGGLLGLLSLFYLVIHPILSRWGMKELYVAIIYTSGILLAPFVLSETFSLTHYLLLFLLSFLNLVLFSWFEQEDDRKDAFSSIATVLSERQIEMLVLALISVGLTLSILAPYSNVMLFFMIAFSVYAFMLLNHTWVRKNELFRMMGDGVFFLPILLL